MDLKAGFLNFLTNSRATLGLEKLVLLQGIKYVVQAVENLVTVGYLGAGDQLRYQLPDISVG